MADVQSLAHIKAHLSEVVDGIEQRHERVVLTRNGRPAAVLLSPDDLEALEATLDLLSDPAALREIDEARAQIEAGDFLDADTLREKYLRR
ncbi:MAG TPA: type II toxin-antitoxin system Phd/YefM family antitoxin [Acidimicrobiales bacterium]|nr:type II toxin-antitoxin system Phd/YefM family antitoxin [Acidimicrobiales bacterium]